MDEEPPPEIRASDAERERGIEVLRDAVVEGRLTLEEFSERVGLAQLARTNHDLTALTADLPARVEANAARAPVVARHRAVASHLVRRGPWSLPGRSSFTSIFGTIDLDLRQARLESADSELEIFNLFGTVTVIVPEVIAVSVEGGGMFASQVVEAPAALPVPGAPALRIRLSGAGGTLRVRTREPPGVLERVREAGRQLRGS